MLYLFLDVIHYMHPLHILLKEILKCLTTPPFLPNTLTTQILMESITTYLSNPINPLIKYIHGTLLSKPSSMNHGSEQQK